MSSPLKAFDSKTLPIHESPKQGAADAVAQRWGDAPRSVKLWLAGGAASLLFCALVAAGVVGFAPGTSAVKGTWHREVVDFTPSDVFFSPATKGSPEQEIAADVGQQALAESTTAKPAATATTTASSKTMQAAKPTTQKTTAANAAQTATTGFFGTRAATASTTTQPVQATKQQAPAASSSGANQASTKHATGHPLCGDDSEMKFTVDGVACKPSKLWDELNHHKGVPGEVITVVATGKCGAFTGPATTFYLRPHTNTTTSTDIPVFRDIYLRWAFGFLSKVMSEVDVRRVMDLGTNTGLSILYWSLHFPKAMVVGVEPELHNYGMAGLNVAHRPNVFVERAAVAVQVGFGNLKAIAAGDWAWGSQPTPGVAGTSGFTSVTVPYLMDRYGWETIDYLKVDIEGAELEICQDIAKGAQWIMKVKCITMELHDRLRPGLPTTIKDTCHSALKDAGMKFHGLHKVDYLYMWCR